MQLMLQATIGDCLSFDPFAFEEDGLRPSEVDVSRGKIVEALVIAGPQILVIPSKADGAFVAPMENVPAGAIGSNLLVSSPRVSISVEK